MTTNNATNNVISRELYQVLKVKLNAAQIIAMQASPVELIPAPGANKGIICSEAVVQFVYGSVAFTGGGIASIVYSGTARAAIGGFTSSFITGTANGIQRSNAGLNVAGPLSDIVNKSVVITNATAPFAGGNSSLIFTISYMIVDTV